MNDKLALAIANKLMDVFLQGYIAGGVTACLGLKTDPNFDECLNSLKAMADQHECQGAYASAFAVASQGVEHTWGAKKKPDAPPCSKCGEPSSYAFGSDTEPDLCVACSFGYLDELDRAAERTMRAEERE